MKKELMDSFRNLFRGKTVTPTDAEYDTARKVYNGMINKYPAIIVQCADVEDVQTCVNFARENNIAVSIRGGGHNAGGLGVWDDALVIDLSQLKNITVDRSAQTVRVQGGCLLKEMDAATNKEGMAVPSGINGTTGVGGLTLGGGLGYLTRHYGLTIDSLIEAEMVLADGKKVTASADENPDLFWAIRGGGGNFGVVVSFVFKMHPVDTVYAGPMLWHIEDSKEMMTWFHNYISKAPDEEYGFFAFLTVPPADPFPQYLQLKKMCGIVWCYSGDMSRAEEIFKPIREYKKPALDFVGPIPYPALQTMFDALYPPGLQWYWKADFVKDLGEEAIDKHVDFGNQLPTMLSTMHLYPINGAASAIGKNDTAWNFRDAEYALVIVGIDDNSAGNDKIIAWTKEYWNTLHPYSAGGAYVNFMMDEGEERVKATYGDNYEKLVRVKVKYDPQNLFRVNQNIKPAKIQTGAAV